MDWSAIFAGVAALAAIAALIYSIHQHRISVRNDFLLWALEQIQSENQRWARALLFKYERPEHSTEKKKIIDGIENGIEEVLYGDELAQIRSVFALFNSVGYFWSQLGYGEIDDAKALFPQIISMWVIGKPYIDAIRKRPNQSDSFTHFENLVDRINKV